MYSLSFSILLSVFCFGFSVYAKTLKNPPNAYLIDHRGIPHCDCLLSGVTGSLKKTLILPYAREQRTSQNPAR